MTTHGWYLPFLSAFPNATYEHPGYVAIGHLGDDGLVVTIAYAHNEPETYEILVYRNQESYLEGYAPLLGFDSKDIDDALTAVSVFLASVPIGD